MNITENTILPIECKALKMGPVIGKEDQAGAFLFCCLNINKFSRMEIFSIAQES